MKVRESASELRNLAMASMYAALTGIGAWIAVPLAAVPITLQVFFVYLAGLMLDPGHAALAMVIYLVMGVVGLPVFAQGSAGLGSVVGPAGGYLFGFIAAATILSLLVGRTRRAAPGRPRAITYLLAFGPLLVASVTILGCGAVWGKFSTGLPWSTILTGWVLPFIPGDIVKIMMALFIGVEMWRRGLTHGRNDQAP